MTGLPLKTMRRLWRSRAGTAATMVALASPAALAGVGFGIDSALMQVSRSQLQAAADAAALAGARGLGSGSAASQAIALAQANMPVALRGDVLAATDVVPGVWDDATGSFTASAASPNAVRTTTRLASANGNAHRLIFGQFLDMPTTDLSATAIAFARSVPSCAAEPYLSYVSNGQPTRTSIVTLGEGSPTTYLKDAEGHPIVRIDNGYDGQASITFQIAGHGNYSFTAPARGQYAVAVTSITDSGPPESMTLVFSNVQSVPVNPGGYGGGTATWINRVRTISALPGTPICQGTAVAATTRAVARLVG